jgi:predicted AlkP superfamily phosphohydrolase/phosphomutase
MSQRARSAFGVAKRRAPAPARRLYNRIAPLKVNRAIAGPTLVAPYDWSRTRVFSVISDQHGWLRVNLQGRERDGIVPERDFETTLLEAEQLFAGLTDDDGNPLAARIVRIDTAAGGPTANLPDLVVHWSDAAMKDPLHIAGTPIETRPKARRLLGVHDLDGFCISAGNGAPGDEIEAVDLHRLMLPQP